MRKWEIEAMRATMRADDSVLRALNKSNKCEYKDCQVKNPPFFIYHFYKDGTKKWANVCETHRNKLEEIIAEMRKEYPSKIFREIK